MNIKRLWVNQLPEKITIDDYIWRRPGDGPQSLHVNIKPDLGEFGNVLVENRDVVWLAVTTFLADRTTARPRGWQREFHTVTPVVNIGRWESVRDDFAAVLSFLTSDEWKTSFVLDTLGNAGQEKCPRTKEEPPSDVVCLFSGGADSLCGVIRALTEGFRPTLMSHWDWPGHSAVQSELVRDIQNLFEVELPHVRVNLGRSAKQVGGASFGDEPSRRSRSFLFIALGLAVASARGPVPLWIAENGFTSLNPPLASERRGALSTRSTHPEFLNRLHGIVQAVGAHAEFTNVFGDLTKGEMFRTVADAIGHVRASELLSKTHSCSHVRWAMQYGRPPGMQCGVCFGCLVRRGAFMSANLEDRTPYLVTDLVEPQRSLFLKSKALQEVETMRYATNRHFGMADVLASELPRDCDPESVLSLIRRGFREIAAVEMY